MKNNHQGNKFTTTDVAKMGMLAAISIVLMYIVRIPFPPAPFLVYDPADVAIFIAAFAFGPVSGLLVTLIVSVIQAFLLGGDGIYGFLMHCVSTGVVAIIIGLMYAKSKTKKRACLALVIGTIATIVIMCAMNLLITPLYMGAPREAVIAMLPTVIIPFNLIKASLNAILTFLLYKRVSGFLHGNK